MNRGDEEALAWVLANSTKAWLPPGPRAWICAKIGAGEQESAIRDVLTFYANSEVALPRELAAPLRTWILGYAGSDSDRILRHLYGRINVAAATQVNDHAPEVDRQRSSPSLTATRSEFAVGTRSRRVDFAGDRR